MTVVRHAIPDDAPELVRLRGIMLTAMRGGPRTARPARPGVWQEQAELLLRGWLADAASTTTAIVVDDPDRPGRLASCVVGTIEQRLGAPSNPGGRIGYVYNVATDPAHRRRGYSRACMRRLLDWFAGQGVSTVDLRASAEGEPLYRSLGFVRTADPAMRLLLDLGA